MLYRSATPLKRATFLVLILRLESDSGRATDAKDRHLEDRHQRVKVPSRYPQGHLKLSLSPQVYQRYVLGRTKGYLPKNSPEMALRYPQGCPMENVDPMVGPVARPDRIPARIEENSGLIIAEARAAATVCYTCSVLL